MGTHPYHTGKRLSQVDSLRGLAALAVILFHFTTRFVDLYRPGLDLPVAFPYGHFGVNLFFIVSGFVIFMTLENTTRPMDFVVSRFSRLFPSYWSAIILTFGVTHWLGLPGKLVDLSPALANFFMMHSIFGVPHVDGVYWTLEVEMLFYTGMFLLFRLRWLGHIHWVLLAGLMLRLIYVGMANWFAIDLPWIAFRLLILQFIPWFALCICVYQLSLRQHHPSNRRSLFTAAMAVLTLAIAESPLAGAIAFVFSTLVYGAAMGRLRWLNSGLFLWLGSISYPLYLIHENIGWSIQLQALARGVPFYLTVLMVLAVSLALATAMTRWIEKPAMRWIRGRYLARRQTLAV